MDELIKTQFDNLYSADADLRYNAFQYLLDVTQKPVDWAYEVWDELLRQLKSSNNHLRSIAAQLLSNLAKSDPDHRMQQDLDQLMEVTKDERFVTARHSLQSLWKVAIVSNGLQQAVFDKLRERYRNCKIEKNGELTRYDIMVVFKKIYDHTKDESIRTIALELIEMETDAKYRKKYTGAWKNSRRDL